MVSTSQTQLPLASLWRWTATVRQPAHEMPAGSKPKSRRRLRTADMESFRLCPQLCQRWAQLKKRTERCACYMTVVGLKVCPWMPLSGMTTSSICHCKMPLMSCHRAPFWPSWISLRRTDLSGYTHQTLRPRAWSGSSQVTTRLPMGQRQGGGGIFRLRSRVSCSGIYAGTMSTDLHLVDVCSAEWGSALRLAVSVWWREVVTRRLCFWSPGGDWGTEARQFLPCAGAVRL